jgi:hypothetical protein
MSDTPAAGNNSPIAHSGHPRTTPARPRAPAQRTQERRRALIVSGGILLLAAVSVAVAIGFPRSGHPLNSPPTASAPPNSELRTAKFTNDSDGKGCWQQTFDNQTGRMTRSQRPCETTAHDSNGVPIPLGTIHRLDAINKSFH